MEYPATTEAQKRIALDWIAYGFERYAERLGPDEEHKVRRYGLEFGRILCKNVDESDLDLPQLRKDLLGLIDQNCPAGDVVEVMMRCTNHSNVLRSRGVQCSDITEQDLSSFKLCSSQAADAILQLRRSALVPESVALFSDAVPRTVEAKERVIHHLTNLSKCSVAITKRLSHSGPPDFPGASWLNAFLKVWDLCFFYLLLRVFHRGYPTLSRLLKVMRRVCGICDGDSEFLREFSCKCITPASGGRSQPKVHDPLSEYALQRQMNRFFHVDPHMTEGLKKCVQFYYSDECMRRLKGTETLMEFCDKVWERLQRGLKRRARKNVRSTRSSTPRAVLIGPALMPAILPTSSLTVRAKNGGSVHRKQQVAKPRLFRMINGRTTLSNGRLN